MNEENGVATEVLGQSAVHRPTQGFAIRAMSLPSGRRSSGSTVGTTTATNT